MEDELTGGLAHEDKLVVDKLWVLPMLGTSKGVVVVETGEGESSIRMESGDRDLPGLEPSLK